MVFPPKDGLRGWAGGRRGWGLEGLGGWEGLEGLEGEGLEGLEGLEGEGLEGLVEGLGRLEGQEARDFLFGTIFY